MAVGIPGFTVSSWFNQIGFQILAQMQVHSDVQHQHVGQSEGKKVNHRKSQYSFGVDGPLSQFYCKPDSRKIWQVPTKTMNRQDPLRQKLTWR
jgi:hypothetical protein